MTIATGGSARRRAAVGGTPSTPRLDVLSSKLERPFRRPGIIDRPALSARVAAATTPLIGFVAPAGYGKSIAMSQSAGASPYGLAWFSADVRDSDPATLVTGIAAAVDAVAPLDDDTRRAVVVPGASVWTGAVARLGAAIAARPGLSIAVDDVDHIRDRDAIDVLLALATGMRGRSRLVVAGRSLGHLPQARLVASGMLTVFSREDLALDRTETAALLVATGSTPRPDDLERIVVDTEGWAAGVYLTSLAMADRERLASSGASAASSVRRVEEFLRTEVLGAMAPGDAELVLHASVLDRLSGPLCDAIMDREGSGADLDRLERRNLFLIPLDPERTWFRFHHLFGGFLRQELERRDAGAASRLRARAARWHAEQGHVEEALEYAMAAGDEPMAARLTMAIAQRAMNQGRMETVRRWFTWYDEREAGARLPQVAGYAALIFAFSGDAERSDRWADIADAASARSDDVDLAILAVARVVRARHGLADLRTTAELAARTTADGHPFRIAALACTGLAAQLEGDYDAADAELEQAVRRHTPGSFANTAAVLAYGLLASNALRRGERSVAEEHVRRARSILVANHLTEEAMSVGIDALEARIALAHGASAQARSDLAHAQRIRPLLTETIPWLAVQARLDLIRAHLALDDRGGARLLLGEIRDILAIRPELGSLVADTNELAERLERLQGGTAGSSTLTLAELRLLPLLTTHLSFREIGERLFVSQNTVKTQAISIYRKLEVTSRSEAIERAVELGLLEAASPRERFIPRG